MIESTQPNQLPMDSVPNETLLKNSEARLNPTLEIEAYLKRQNPDYLRQLESFSTQIVEQMNKESKLVVCIPVAAHQESSNIYHTLKSFSKQTRDPKEFEILLFVNSPERAWEEKREDIEKTMNEIKKAQKEFPHLQIRVAQAFFPQDQVRIGNIRKICTDLALLRQKQVEIKRDLILVSNDADNLGISEEYINAYIEYFEEHPEKEGAVGNLQFDPNTFIRFPVIHLKQEFSTFLDQVGFQNGNVTLFGSNSCMKSSIYASIGGYPPGLKTGEQEWTGKTIRGLRKTRSTLGFVKNGPIVTSSRRAVASLALNTEGEIRFGDQEAETKMRALDLDSFPLFDYANKEALEKLRQELEKVINQIIETYEEGDKLGKDAYYYRENLKKVGIQYEVGESGIIHITNMDRFIERQELMQRMIKGGEKNMAKVIEASWKLGTGEMETKPPKAQAGEQVPISVEERKAEIEKMRLKELETEGEKTVDGFLAENDAKRITAKYDEMLRDLEK